MRSIFFRPPSTSSSLEPLQNSENDGSEGTSDGQVDADSIARDLLTIPPTLRERSTSLTTLGEMPKAEKVSRSSSDISLASTVALDDFAHNVEPTFDVTDATIIARQSEIEEMRNFVRKQKTKLFVLMDNYVDFVAHQVVAVMNTVVRYKEVNEEARVARRDDKIVKNESPFFYKVKFNILPVFHDLAIHINNYSQVSDDIELQKCLCQQTKQKMDNIYKLIAYLMDGDPILENDVKNNKLPDQTSSHSEYIYFQRQIRLSMLGFSRIYRAAEEMYRVIKFN